MKNLFTLVVVFFLVQKLSFAQETAQFRKFGIGVIGGTQAFGKIYNSDNMKSTSGIMAGLDLRYSLSGTKDGFSLHLQPNYSTYKEIQDDGDPNNQMYTRSTWKWTAVNVPLLIRYTLPTGSIRPFFETGLNARFRTSLAVYKRGHACGIIRCSGVDQRLDLNDDTTRDKIGILAGVGAEIDVWKVTIPVSVRINEGIGEYQMKESREDSYHYDGLKTRTLQISAGITF